MLITRLDAGVGFQHSGCDHGHPRCATGPLLRVTSKVHCGRFCCAARHAQRMKKNNAPLWLFGWETRPELRHRCWFAGAYVTWIAALTVCGCEGYSYTQIPA